MLTSFDELFDKVFGQSPRTVYQIKRSDPIGRNKIIADNYPNQEMADLAIELMRGVPKDLFEADFGKGANPEQLFVGVAVKSVLEIGMT